MTIYRLFHCALYVVTTFVLALFNVGVQADQTLWSLVWASHEQAKLMNYSGLLITESGQYSQTSKLLHQASLNGGEFEILERLDGQPAKWIRHNDQIQCIIPDQKMILTERRHTSTTFPQIFVGPNGAAPLEAFYNISELTGRRVAGRSVRVLKLMPKDDLRYEYRLYLDRENHLLMRSELYSLEGEVLENIGFKEISFEPVLLENPALTKAGPGWRTNSTVVKTLLTTELPYNLPETLFGFKKADTVCRVKGKDDQIHQTVYSDGLSTLSVFIHKTQTNHSLPQMSMRHGAVMSKSENKGDYLITVLGEVPEKTLGLFLKSVRWKSQ